jgi:hypothetical protein
MKNIKIQITKDDISIFHYGEQIVCWDSEEWNENPDLVTYIANMLTLANEDNIYHLRALYDKPLIIGTTKVTDEINHRVAYYINNMDDSGREDISVLFFNRDEAYNAWTEMTEDESVYDMHMYIALVEVYDDDYEVLDDEVIETYLVD